MKGSTRITSRGLLQVNLCCVEFMDYCAQQSVLAVVLADGRCAVCRTASGSLHPISAMEVQEFVCGVGRYTIEVLVLGCVVAILVI